MSYDAGSGQLTLGSDGSYIEYYRVNLAKCVPKDLLFDPKNTI